VVEGDESRTSPPSGRGRELWLRLLLLLGIVLALLVTFQWLSEGDHKSPAVASAPSVSAGTRLVTVPDVVGVLPA
jgi:hypothetical protein